MKQASRSYAGQRALRAKAGFTLIELLVVMSLPPVTIGLLLPAVQKVREAAARQRIELDIKAIAKAQGETFRKTGRFAPTMAEALASAGLPGSGEFDGYRAVQYEVAQGSWKLALNPSEGLLHSGGVILTGLQDGSVRFVNVTLPDPVWSGAEAPAAELAGQARALLGTRQEQDELANQTLDYLATPAASQAVISRLTGPDGTVSLASIDDAIRSRQAFGDGLAGDIALSYWNKLAARLGVGMYGEQWRSAPGVRPFAGASVADGYSIASLQKLVDQLVGDANAAAALHRFLRASDVTMKRGVIGSANGGTLEAEGRALIRKFAEANPPAIGPAAAEALDAAFAIGLP